MSFPKKGSCPYFSAGLIINSLVTPSNIPGQPSPWLAGCGHQRVFFGQRFQLIIFKGGAHAESWGWGRGGHGVSGEDRIWGQPETVD